jgi:hypothetical protein
MKLPTKDVKRQNLPNNRSCLVPGAACIPPARQPDPFRARTRACGKDHFKRASAKIEALTAISVTKRRSTRILSHHQLRDSTARQRYGNLKWRLADENQMNLLLQSKEEAEAHFGQKATMAVNLLGMVNRGEKACGFLTGAADEGFDITIGFFKGKARYIAFKKRTGTAWGEGDLRASLMQIGRYANWLRQPGSDFIDYVEKKGDEIVAEATGWQTPRRRYAFVYVADVPGEIALLPDKTALDQKFPT